jgi:hypothetical protein
VIDFTQFSDKELINYFTKNKKNVCGRLNENQLNKEFDFYKPSIQYSKILRIIAGLFVLSSFNQLKSQSLNTINQETYQDFNKKDSVFHENPIKSSEIEYVSKIFLKITDIVKYLGLCLSNSYLINISLQKKIVIVKGKRKINYLAHFEINVNQYMSTL